jgi:hypothetical protein
MFLGLHLEFLVHIRDFILFKNALMIIDYAENIFHQTDWARSMVVDFYSGRYSVRILGGAPVTLTEVFHGFPQSLHSNMG